MKKIMLLFWKFFVQKKYLELNVYQKKEPNRFYLTIRNYSKYKQTNIFTCFWIVTH